jgi:hypothetical protein
MFQEGYYENSFGTSVVDQQSQAMITYLGGGRIGHVFGSCPLWSFGAITSGLCDNFSPPFDSWQNNLNSAGSISAGKLGQLMQSRKWWTFVPDYSNAVVISYKGTDSGYYATARESAGGDTVMVWAPDIYPITVNMAAIGGTQARAWWFNANDGTSVDLGVFSATGSRSFSPPRSSSVLVLDNADLNLAAPGTTVYSITPDITAPTSPANLTATAVSSSQINLAWTASIDDRIVAGYKVFRDSIQVATNTANIYSDTGLARETSYTYTIEA